MSSQQDAIVIDDDDDKVGTPQPASLQTIIPDRAQLEQERLARVRARQAAQGLTEARATPRSYTPAGTDAEQVPAVPDQPVPPSSQSTTELLLPRVQERKRRASQDPPLTWSAYTPKRCTTAAQPARNLKTTAPPPNGPTGRYTPIRSTDRFWRGAFKPNGLRRVLLTSYDVEIDWLLLLFPRVPVTYIGNPPRGDAERDPSIPPPGFYPCSSASNWEMGVPAKPHPGALQHSKLLLLFFATHVRVVISTGNLSQVDWSRYENVDFPPHPTEPASQRSSGIEFRVQLERVLQSLSLPRSHPVFEGLQAYSFESAAAHIVASWPVSKVTGWREIARAGIGRLHHVVRTLGMHIPHMNLEAQGSSLGVYERRWLEQFYLMACGSDVQGVVPLPRRTAPGASPELTRLTGCTEWPHMTILFPTQTYVQERFVEGPPGAGCFFAKPDDFRKKELRPLFGQPVSCRGDILMHAKCLVGQAEGTGWVYLGSANFTRAAWGTIAGTTSAPTLSLNNWELGVVLPLDSPDIEGSAWDAVPYRRPVEAYGAQDTPWDIGTLGRNLVLAEGEVYSQPAATGVGVHESTQLVAAVDALKVRYNLTQRHGNPVRLEDFALMHGLNGLLDSKSGLFQRFVQHPKVEYNAKTDLYSYKPDYNVHNSADLVALLREKYYHPSALNPQSAAAGMRVAELKESYPQAREAVEELANAQPVEDREVLVLRGKRDGAIKHVFWNPIRGEEVRPIDPEFKELWRSLRVPDVVDLAADLESEGLSTTKEVDNAPKVQAQPSQRGRKGKPKRGAAPRKFKLQNTHLQGVDLSRDFVKQ
ncbi:hypothetical protein MBRA1_001822 [Malassezia brasiliensis]|uniref:TFIIE beta domain-containing protein n=1 Tax=Malassezia brasiliensis TaxID=1821822 RepID=A0AAF0IPP7_9BASI|nr:hypothetical protein MBRA1_001822 [Malassezia brasiliensis]